jgi:sec-independent protein translocase protein TatB
MFDLSWSHILLVVVVALVVVGPKDLPKLMRTVGRWLGKARSMADQFRKSFDEMTRQAELDELRAEIESLRSSRPLSGVEQDLNKSILPDEFTAKPMSSTPPAPEAETGERPAAEPVNTEGPTPAEP